MSKDNISPNNAFGNTQNYNFNDLPRFVLLVAKNEEYDEDEKELLAKAQEWSIPIPYDSNDAGEIDFNALEDLICDYRLLLERAEELDLYWNISYYSPKSLEWAISAREDELLESGSCDSSSRYY